MILLPRHSWQYPETFLVVTVWSGGEGATGILGAEARDAAKLPAVLRMALYNNKLCNPKCQ